MNDFERELRRLLEQDTALSNKRFVGKICIGNVSEDVNARIEFVTRGTADHYPAIKATLINKSEGVVDSLTLTLRDVIGGENIRHNQDMNKDLPYLWTYNGQTEWYGYVPTTKDCAAISSAVTDYLEMFQTQTQAMGFSQRM